MRPGERKRLGYRADQFRRRRLRFPDARQFRRRCLHNLTTSEEHRTHPLEIAMTKAPPEARREVRGEALDEALPVAGTPTTLLLSFDDSAPDESGS